MLDTTSSVPGGCFPPPPVPCPPPGGFLMQQIVGAGRAYLRYQRFCLPLTDLPCDARAPLTVAGVEAQSCGLRAERCGDPCGRGLSLRVYVPLCVTLRDGCGCCFPAASHIDVNVPMRLFDPREADRAQPVVSAFVRLNRACAPCCDAHTPEAWLDVCVEAWLTACRPMYGGACPPPCPPPLPLSPQPCRPR